MTQTAFLPGWGRPDQGWCPHADPCANRHNIRALWGLAGVFGGKVFQSVGSVQIAGACGMTCTL